MEDITTLFDSIIEDTPSIDIAESQFKQSLIDNPELKRAYREYCREQGTSEKHGFLDYCEEYASQKNEIWDNLNDFDNVE